MIHGVLSRYVFPFFVALLYLFLYIPLVVLTIFSFNANRFRFDWVGFTTKWYVSLWYSSEVWHALKNSLIVATFSVFLCLSMSVLFVFFGRRTYVRRMLVLFYGNLALPEIVLAVGLMCLFYFFSIP